MSDYLPIIASTEQAYSNWLKNFWDPAGHMLPTQGDGGSQNGYVYSGASGPTMWQMSISFNVLYERWLNLGTSDPEKATLAVMIQSHWTWIQTKFLPADLRQGTAQIVNTLDDAVWHANFLKQVHEVTHDPNALAYLAEFIPYTLNRFADPLQSGSMHDYGLSPGSLPFKFGYWGTLYIDPSAPDKFDKIRTYGYCSSGNDALLGIVALYVYGQGVANAAGYLAYARDAYGFANSLRTGSPVSGGDSVQGLYYQALNLDPNVGAANAVGTGSISGTTLTITSVTRNAFAVGQYLAAPAAAGTKITGGSGSTWTVNMPQSVPAGSLNASLAMTGIGYPGTEYAGQPVEEWHKGVHAYFGRPVRGLAAEGDALTLAVAVLAVRLNAISADAAKVAEAQHICEVFADPTLNNFGRRSSGVPVIGNLRDPWGSGYYYPEFVRVVLPAVPSASRLKIAPLIVNTGLAILEKADASGYLSADWSDPEENLITHKWTWAEDCYAGFGGLPGGGEANPRQIMTSSMGLQLAMAGAQISKAGSVGSGTPDTVQDSDLPGILSAVFGALETKLSGSSTINVEGDVVAAGIVSAPIVQSGTAYFSDGLFYAQTSGGNPRIVWDNNDLTAYDRAANTLVTYVANNPVWQSSAAENRSSVPLVAGAGLNVTGNAFASGVTYFGDSVFYSAMVVNPRTVYDNGDFTAYDRANNRLVDYINNSVAWYTSGSENRSSVLLSAYSGLVVVGASTFNGSINVIGNTTVNGNLTYSGFLYSDANYYQGLSGSNPFINFDAYDYMLFNRASNKLAFVIGNNVVMTIDGNGNLMLKGSLVPGTPTA